VLAGLRDGDPQYPAWFIVDDHVAAFLELPYLCLFLHYGSLSRKNAVTCIFISPDKYS